MEKEEKRCFPSNPRLGKKVLFTFVIVNILIWLVYYNSCYVSQLSTESKLNVEKTVFIPIYDIPLYHIPLLDTKDMSKYYTEIKSEIWCLNQGTYLLKSKNNNKCVCLETWFGLDCGIPSAIWKSSFLQEGKNKGIEIRRRKKPRRIIVSFSVDEQIELLDINIQNIFPLVDLFLTIESKNQHLVLNLIKTGKLAESQNKIIPLQLNTSSDVMKEEKWSSFMLSELWKTAWNRVSDFRPDDILLFSHVSSIISKDVLLFLKLYDGFPEPFTFELRPLLFKFWRLMKLNNTDVPFQSFKPIGCTFQFISSMCDFSVEKFFSNTCLNDVPHKTLFEKNFWYLESWSVGNIFSPSGWQCNLCCSKDCIKEIIQQYIKNGSTFLPLQYVLGNISVHEKYIDDVNYYNSKELTFEVISKTDPFFAPDVILNNSLPQPPCYQKPPLA